MTGPVPTGTVTLLLADIEGSTRLWETEQEAMTVAIARLDEVLDAAVDRYGGVRPLDQGEGDSFVIAFARASDAVECALALQRAAPAPIRLRMGLHTGEVQLRDESNYVGVTVSRAGRLRDLAHGGQVVLSGATYDVVVDFLPDAVSCRDLGSHQLRGLSRPEHLMQLCHPELPTDFPPLRTLDAATHNLPAQLTTFVGRSAEVAEVRALVAEHRCVTLTGAGGAGKTRLAVHVAAGLASEFRDGVWLVDLAAITDPDVVTFAVARALGLPDEPFHTTIETVVRALHDQHALVVLDNCEHLLDACAVLVEQLLGQCAGLRLLTTSREPIAAAGEVLWRVPSLSLTDEAVELFSDRAQRIRPDFRLTADNTEAVLEICRRLDGIPLAIELAAARVRALSPTEIVESLHDRFRLLTGGARTAMQRQQTLRASVDWSHALLTDPERALFRRLAAFMGGFDFDAAQAICAGDGLERYQVLDQLASLVDKSLVTTEETDGITRYRLLETVRQYALEKLGESGEADTIRTRHRDHFTALAATLDAPVPGEWEGRIERAEADIDNLRAAFAWSCEASDTALALQLASRLQPVWLGRSRIVEGRQWLDAALAADDGTPTAERAYALAAHAVLDTYTGSPDTVDHADEAVAIARNLDAPALLARALAARGGVSTFDAGQAQPFLDEAIVLARKNRQQWTVCQILGWQAFAATISNDHRAALAAAEEGLALARQIGDSFAARQCRAWAAEARFMRGELAFAKSEFQALIRESEDARDAIWTLIGLNCLCRVEAEFGNYDEAATAAQLMTVIASDLGGFYDGITMLCVATAALARGDTVELAAVVRQSPPLGALNETTRATFRAESALAAGDLAGARAQIELALSVTDGPYNAMRALVTSARIARAAGDTQRSERDAYDALGLASTVHSIAVPDVLEAVATSAAGTANLEEAARLLGAAAGARERMGAGRYALYDAEIGAVAASLRQELAADAFERCWKEGAALTLDDAIAYAQRGRGERKRPASGWASLTPTELDVVTLLAEGLPNKEIAERLFISPRTVQSHLTHVYTKLGLSSRVQLAQEAARRR